jgi:hypothetical protein
VDDTRNLPSRDRIQANAVGERDWQHPRCHWFHVDPVSTLLLCAIKRGIGRVEQRRRRQPESRFCRCNTRADGQNFMVASWMIDAEAGNIRADDLGYLSCAALIGVWQQY